MFSKKHIIISLFIFIFTIGNASAKVNESELAPNFTLKSHSGKNIKLSELRGQVVILNFWASWCSTCLQQFSVIKKLYNKNKNKRFQLLSINLDENTKKAKSIIKKRNLRHTVLFDSANQVSRLYSAEQLPALVLIDKDGRKRYTLNETQINQRKIIQEIIEGLLND